MAPKEDNLTISEEKWDLIIAFIVIAIFSFFVYLFVFKSTEEATIQNSIEEGNPLIESTPISDKESQNSSTYQRTTIQVEDAYESDVNTAIIIADFKKSKPITTDSLSKPIPVNTKTIRHTETEKILTDSIATNPQRGKKEELSNQIKEKITPKTSTVEPIVATKIESTTTKTAFNCVVIVGVFKTASNKESVLDKLKSLGYDQTAGVLRDGLSYVGVPVACENRQEREKLLRELNQAFGIDSWVKKI